MKFKITQKEIKENYKYIIRVPYCALQHLLSYTNEKFYLSSQTYGWKADVHEIRSDIVIVTGYAPFGNNESNYEFNKKIDRKAQEVLYDASYQNKKALLNSLIGELIDFYVPKYTIVKEHCYDWRLNKPFWQYSVLNNGKQIFSTDTKSRAEEYLKSLQSKTN